MQSRYACSNATLSRPAGSMPIKVGSGVPRGEVVDGDVAVDPEPEPIPLDDDPEVEDPDDEPGMLEDPDDEPGVLEEPDDEPGVLYAPDDEPGMLEDPDDEPDEPDEYEPDVEPDDEPEPGVVVVPLRGSADPLEPEPTCALAMRLQLSKSVCVGVLVWAAARPHRVARLAVVTMAVVIRCVRIGSSSRMRLKPLSFSKFKLCALQDPGERR